MMRGTLICLGLLMASTTAQADNLRVGGDVAFVMPLGPWGDGSSIGIGGMAKGEFLVSPQLALTGRLGYIYHVSKEDLFGITVATAEMPLLIGGKFYILQEATGLYAAAEIGFVSYSVIIGGASFSHSYFGATAGGGFEIGGFDLRAGLFLPSLADAGDIYGVLFTAGYAVPIF